MSIFYRFASLSNRDQYAKFVEIFEAMHKADEHGRRTYDIEGTNRLIVAIEAGEAQNIYTALELGALKFHAWFVKNGGSKRELYSYG